MHEYRLWAWHIGWVVFLLPNFTIMGPANKLCLLNLFLKVAREINFFFGFSSYCFE